MGWRRGGFHIRPGIWRRGGNCPGRRGRRPLQTILNTQSTNKVAIIARFLGGVKTPPYSTNGQGGVGAHSVRPCDLAVARDSCGRTMLAPTAAAKPPLCKGRWHGGAVTEGLWPCGGRSIFGQGHNPSVSFADTAYAAGPLCRCATSPHAVGSHPLHKGAIPLPP